MEKSHMFTVKFFKWYFLHFSTKALKELWNISADAGESLSGLKKVIDAVTEIFNKNSDDCGAWKKHINISEFYVWLYVKPPMTLANFIL